MSARTGLSIGPSGLSTVIIVLCALGMLGGLSAIASTRGVWDRPLNVLLGLGAVTLHVAGLYGYYVHYRRCSPWLGWFIFVTAVTVAGMLMQGIQRPADGRSTALRW